MNCRHSGGAVGTILGVSGQLAIRIQGTLTLSHIQLLLPTIFILHTINLEAWKVLISNDLVRITPKHTRCMPLVVRVVCASFEPSKTYSCPRSKYKSSSPGPYTSTLIVFPYY